MTLSAAEAGRRRRVAVVPGATGGIGIHVAAGLVAVGHQVLVTGRNQARGAAAIDLLRRQAPGGLAPWAGAAAPRARSCGRRWGCCCATPRPCAAPTRTANRRPPPTS
jgi:NAD(P)-dependent dehydrogenase (short-subunit alcohol dehydrogenase family)